MHLPPLLWLLAACTCSAFAPPPSSRPPLPPLRSLSIPLLPPCPTLTDCRRYLLPVPPLSTSSVFEINPVRGLSYFLFDAAWCVGSILALVRSKFHPTQNPTLQPPALTRPLLCARSRQSRRTPPSCPCHFSCRRPWRSRCSCSRGRASGRCGASATTPGTA
jgi:hypothetical protein